MKKYVFRNLLKSELATKKTRACAFLAPKSIFNGIVVPERINCKKSKWGFVFVLLGKTGISAKAERKNPRKNLWLIAIGVEPSK
jgi:hypothetical protein